VRDLPAETRDGVRVEVHINAGLRIDIPQIAETGADGVGPTDGNPLHDPP
jgi:phosphotransferase system enzyme I (PtsP)